MMVIKRLFQSKDPIEMFWKWFLNHEQEYYDLQQEELEYLFEQLERQLDKINPDLVFEFSAELVNEKREFIISADGLVENFSDVIALVEAAPPLERFDIIAFRQPATEEFAVGYQEVELTWDDVLFTYKVDSENDLVDLVLYIKGFEEDNEDYIAAVFILLDCVIGEFVVGTEIGEIVFKPYKQEEELLPISKLRGVCHSSGFVE
ncbi:hypothetical protein [Bacillus sp. FJAT-52991]|uniref:DUF695 domain-containing protein n=1 Tax=Bacillus kandeliae TaxID=3129297 RepID=A0ABZ2N480_9BACI